MGMFTGIVEETGRVVAFARGAEAWRLEVAARVVASDVAVGDSVAVNGCCLTVARREGERLWFDVLEETCENAVALRRPPGVWSQGAVSWNTTLVSCCRARRSAQASENSTTTFPL